MKKIVYTCALGAISFLSTTNSSFAQSSKISLFHLGDYVQQSGNVSPVYLPKNSFSMNLIGIGAQLSNNFSGADLLKPSGVANELKYDFLNIYDNLDGDHSNINQELNVNILAMAFKRKHGSLTFFVNARENINVGLSKNGLVNLLANGINDEVKFEEKINSTVYAEGGIGFTQQLLKDKLAIAVRVKYLLGLANASTAEDGFAKINVNDDLTWTVNTNNAIAKISGIPADGETPKLGQNTGIGFDFGASYKILPNLTIEAAVNDIGSITWKDNIKEYYLNDATDVVIEGADFDQSGDIGENLFNKIKEDIGSGEREGTSYTTNLATSGYASVSYLLAKKHMFRGTYFQNLADEEAKPIMALGYNLDMKKTTIGVVGIKNIYDEIDLGLNFAAKLAFFQLYFATDNINKLLGPVQDIKNINAHVGLNLVFGYKKWLKK